MNEDSSRKTAKSKKRRQKWFALTAVLLSTSVGLILGEAIVRLICGVPLPLGWPPEQRQGNVVRGSALVPNSEYWLYYPIKINGIGLRERELTSKGPNECRILLLGDSMVFGQGVDDRGTISALTEQVLNASVNNGGMRYRVVNGGIRGYSTNQELGLLREIGGAIQPDVVVLVWYWNDIAEADIEKQYADLSGRPKRELPSTPPWQWRIRELARRSAFLMLAHDALRFRDADSFDSSQIEGSLERLEDYLDEFLVLADEREFKFAIAIVPPPSALGNTHPFGTHAARIETRAESRAIPVVNLLEPLEELYSDTGRLPIIPYDGHYNSDGNRAMAEIMANFLRAM